MHLDFRLHGGSQDTSNFPRCFLIFDYKIDNKIYENTILVICFVNPIKHMLHDAVLLPCLLFSRTRKERISTT